MSTESSSACLPCWKSSRLDPWKTHWTVGRRRWISSVILLTNATILKKNRCFSCDGRARDSKGGRAHWHDADGTRGRKRLRKGDAGCDSPRGNEKRSR